MAGVKVTEQVADAPVPDREHVVEEKAPDLLAEKVTIPVGVAAVPGPLSVTVAVHVVGEPLTNL